MSRPLKLKAIGACLSAFELPDLGLLGLFAGAHRRRFPFYLVEELLLIPPETKPASHPLRHVINSSYGCDRLLFRSRLSFCEPLQPSAYRIGDCEGASE
jgi:hypothetical protein